MRSRPITEYSDDALATELDRPPGRIEKPGRFMRIGEVPIEQPDWLIKSYVQSDSLWQVFGKPGSLKSFLVVDWLASIASGQPWNAMPVKRGPALYVVGEGASGIRRRVRAWEIHHGIDLNEWPFYVRDIPTRLLDPDEFIELQERIDDVVEDAGNPVVIVFDTLSRNFGPGDENDTKDMQRAVATLDRIRVRYGCSAGIVHHSGHVNHNRGRGSMVLPASLDYEYRTERTESIDGVSAKLVCTKSKDTEPPEPISLTVKRMQLDLYDEEGDAVTSLVLEPTAARSDQLGSTYPVGKHQAAILRVFDQMVSEMPVNSLEDREEGGDRPRVRYGDWRRRCLESGVPKNRFTDAFNALSRRKVIYKDAADFVNLIL